VSYDSPSTIIETLRGARTVALVGLSSNELRPSHFVGFYLQRHGYRVLPVNPREQEVLGERSYASLSEIEEPIDIVDVFRAPDAVPAIAEEAVAVGAKSLWLQYGVISPEGAEIATRGGLNVVMDRCMKIEHARYLGRMHWLGFNTGRITARR
jgi:predicted CoA-binding protein